jgi:hypothetical protein
MKINGASCANCEMCGDGNHQSAFDCSNLIGVAAGENKIVGRDCDGNLKYKSSPCFSAHATVNVLGQGNATPMHQLKIGDMVLTSKGHYSKVYSFGHKDSFGKTEYLQILSTTMEKNHPLEITADHLLYANGQLVMAGDVKVGDFLVTPSGTDSVVVSIHKIESQGMYTPLTATGDIVVNGVLASNYADVGNKKFNVALMHFLQHGSLAPYHLYCGLVGGCEDETYHEMTKLNAWAMFWLRTEHFFKGSLHPVLQVPILMLAILPGAVFFVFVGKLFASPGIESLLLFYLAMALVSWSAWKSFKVKVTKMDGIGMGKKSS